MKILIFFKKSNLYKNIIFPKKNQILIKII